MMDVHVKLLWDADVQGITVVRTPGMMQRMIEATGLREGTLSGLLRQVAKRNPDLAPILEDAFLQKDLEIHLNNGPRLHNPTPDMPLHHGDTVSLLVHCPDLP